MERKAHAVWIGTLAEGNGMISTDSGALTERPYSFASRFENAKGTNPEELIGAAHAACFSMAFAADLTRGGYRPESIQTDATVHLEKQTGGWKITGVDLLTWGNVPGISRQEFERLAEEAKNNCPVSKFLNGEIRVRAVLAEGEESLSA